MSDAVSAELKHFLFTVPAHVASVIFGGGCGAAHSGEADCERCQPLAAAHIYPLAPEPEQADTSASTSPAAAAAPEAPAPVPDVPAKSKKSAPSDDAAPSA
jgi:hypothetical protein